MEKNSQRRTEILNVAVRLIATHGLEGMTHRAVDKAAGLPPGSSSYYFPKKTLLLIATANHLAELLEKDCDELQVGFADKASKHGLDAAIEYVAEELVTYADNSKDLFLARMELTIASARREDLSEVGDLLTSAARCPIEFFLELISEGRKDIPIETCAGLIDGITLIYATGQGPKPTTDQIKAVFHSIL